MKNSHLLEAENEFIKRHTVWFVIYVLVNIATLGSLWLLRGLITYAIYLAQTEVKAKGIEKQKLG